MRIFISSNDAQAGKTIVAAGLAAVMQSLGYQSGYLKPIQLGAEENFGFLVSPDTAYVKNVDPYIECLCSYIFKTTAAPAIASELEGIKIDSKVILKDYKKLQQKCETIFVEGGEGLMVPISGDFLMADVAKLLNLPVLFVINPQVGNVNSILLNLNQAKSLGLKTVGVVINKFPYYLNDVSIKSTPRIIEEYSDAKVLGIVPQLANEDNLTPAELIDLTLNSLDIEQILGIPLPKLHFG